MVDDERGFTLLELIVVIAILGMLYTIAVPQYMGMTLRTRMSVDVATTKVLQNQVEFYYADTGRWPGNDVDTVMDTLIKNKCVDTKYLEDTDGDHQADSVHFQTSGAQLKYASAWNRLYVEVKEADYNQLRADDIDKDVWIVQTGQTPNEFITQSKKVIEAAKEEK